MKCLTPLKKGMKKYDFIGFDIETYSKKNKFLVAGFYDDKYYNFKKETDAFNFIDKQKNKFIVATNLAFDFNGLFYKNEKFFDYEIIMRGGNYIICYKKDINFIDTMSIATNSSVDKLGKMLNMPKLKYKNIGLKPKNINEWHDLLLYNSQDCKISKTFMEYWQKALNQLGGEFKITIASSAMDLFRRKYLKKTIWHEPKHIKNFMFKSYYGGRVECFKRGNIKDMYYYDFNSLYPSCMLNQYPEPSSINEGDINDFYFYISKYEGASDVLIKAPDSLYYPFLPYRYENKLVFPLGIFRGVYTHLELRKALDLGYEIITCFKCYYYKKLFYPFKEYVTELYNLRCKYKNEGNDIMQYACKILLNSLYGKFGSKHFDTIKFFKKNNNKKLAYFSLDEDTAYDITKKTLDRNYIIPIFASYTTAYGRIKLYDSLVKLKGIYCDTDSIITSEEIKSSQELGELKLEKKISNGYIIKPKMYMVNEEVKIKGIKKADKNDFFDIMKGKSVKKEKFIKIKESIVQNLSVNEIIEITKTVDLEDNKRYWKYKFNKDSLQNSSPLIILENKIRKSENEIIF